MKTFLSPLTPEEEKECIERMKEGDLKAKHQLIEHNLRLVAHVAKKYQASDEGSDFHWDHRADQGSRNI